MKNIKTLLLGLLLIPCLAFAQEKTVKYFIFNPKEGLVTFALETTGAPIEGAKPVYKGEYVVDLKNATITSGAKVVKFTESKAKTMYNDLQEHAQDFIAGAEYFDGAPDESKLKVALKEEKWLTNLPVKGTTTTTLPRLLVLKGTERCSSLSSVPVVETSSITLQR